MASAYARGRGLPRVYIAANSGARIGLAGGVREKLRVAWHNDAMPSKGFEYLYLNAEDHAALSAKGAVQCERIVTDAMEERFKLTAVIGEEPEVFIASSDNDRVVVAQFGKELTMNLAEVGDVRLANAKACGRTIVLLLRFL